MSSPAASAPVAVLVLAWDETTPAVRALVEATATAAPALDSVVVLVPAGPATQELTPEEFLPLADSLLPAPPPAPAGHPQPASAAPTATEAAALPTADAPSLAASAPAPTVEDTPAPAEAEAAASLSLTSDAAALPAGGVDSAAAPAPADQPRPAVAAPQGLAMRVVRLSDFSLASLAAYAQQALPAPAWVGPADAPAAPYLGSSPAEYSAAAVPASGPSYSSDAAVAATPGAAAALAAALQPLEGAALPAPGPADALPSYLPEEIPAAPDAEPDSAALPAPHEPVPAADASTIELSAEAADPADAFAVDVTPVQAGWPTALAALQKPAPYAEAGQPGAATAVALPVSDEAAPPAPAPETAPEPTPQPATAALLPATQVFEAPNLNFQIIQYARFAVPLAQAEQPFAVIYAPAWPTWLAAQELRQRTGCPLVLHVATLAAENEPLNLAAGWAAEIQRQALHRADLILTETPALAARLRRELDLPAHRVRSVPATDAAAVAQALGTVPAY